MLYELVNPSDKIVFEAPNEQIACFCAWALSTGFGVTDQNGQGYGIPSFHGNDNCMQNVFGYTNTDKLDQFAIDNGEEIKKCFRSFFYGSFGDYEQYNKALSLITEEDKRIEFMKHNEDRRSSMNKIVNAALLLGGIVLKDKK